MNEDSFPKRRRNRKRGFDYTAPRSYFVTSVVQGRLPLFGSVVDGTMVPNDAGRMVEQWWDELKAKFSGVSLPAFVVMPNHIHGIVQLPGDTDRRSVSLSRVMHWMGTMTTNAYIRGVKDAGWRRFDGKLWQRSFHDHIIRKESSFQRILDYIADNPARWTVDRENPERTGEDEFDHWLQSDAGIDGDDE